jgi:hypothetical protein
VINSIVCKQNEDSPAPDITNIRLVTTILHRKNPTSRPPVTADFDRQVRQGLRRRGRFPIVLLTVGLLAVIAAAAVYVWLDYDNQVQQVSFAAPRVAAPATTSGEGTAVLQRDFESFKRQIAESMLSTVENIDAQKVDLAKLSYQVSAMAAKIDALQSALASTGASLGELRPGTQPVVPTRPVVAAGKKQLAPKTTGPTSVGGAPQLPAPSADR